MKRTCGLLALAVGVAVMASSAGAADKAADWYQWRGPTRDSISTETGLLKAWPADGPKLLWKLEGMGMGYTTPSIADGKIFTMGDRGESQFLIVYDLETRKELWATKVGSKHRDGPRCTPAYDGQRVFVLGTDGRLVCCNTADGKIIWQKDMSRDFGGKMMSGWRWSESPLVDGDRLICTPGGKRAGMVALNKVNGEVIWKSVLGEMGDKGKDGAGYSSVVISNGAGVKQYVQLAGRGVFGVDAETGKFLWSYNRVANGVANITTPIATGDYVFASSSYNTGSVLLKLSKAAGGVKATEVWWLGSDEFENHHGGVILKDGHFYGGTKKNGGKPTCVELATGKVVWQENTPARGSSAYLWADGHFIIRYDSGLVTLVKASPSGYKIVSKFTPPTGKGPAWPHPVVHGGRLYLRHGDFLLCYDLRG